MIKWKESTKLVVSDVDDTIAPVYQPMTKEMKEELEKLLKNHVKFLLISGQSVGNIVSRVTNFIAPELRRNMMIAHCNGAEGYGFNEVGDLVEQPFFSILDEVKVDREIWKKVMKEIEEEFGLTYVFTTKPSEFKKIAGDDKHFVMVEDRHVQMSLDFVNGVGEPDIRLKIADFAKRRFETLGMPLTTSLGGLIAIDFNIQGVNKGFAVEKIIQFGEKFAFHRTGKIMLSSEDELEIWGDSFSVSSGNSDFNMCRPLPKSVRTICFRHSPDLEQGYNIKIWDGKEELAEGTYEYLKLSHVLSER